MAKALHDYTKMPTERARASSPLTVRERRYIKDRQAGKVLNPVPGFPVTFGWHVPDRFSQAGHHTGEDHACPPGTPLVAVTWGHVIGVGWGGAPHNLGDPYGNVVLIAKASGDLEYFYAHMSRFNVHLGDAVKPGQVIGWSGFSGNVVPAGPAGGHCHFEARPLNGAFESDINPLFVEQSGFKG